MHASFALRPAWGIRSLLAALVLAAVLPLAALIGFHIYHDAAEAERREADSSRRVAEQTARNIARFLEEARLALEGFARRGARLLDKAHCESLAANFVSGHSIHANLTVRDLDDRLLCAAHSAAGLPAQAVDPASFQRAIIENRFVIGAVLPGPVTGRWVVLLRQPIRDGTGKVIGVITAPVDVAHLQGMIQDVELPPGGVIVVSANDGTILARSSDVDKWVGRNVRGIAVVHTAIERGQGQVTGRGVDGIERVYGFTTVAETGWNVASGIPVEIVQGPSRAALLRSIAIFLVVIAAVAALTGALARYIVLPIQKLTGIANAVAAGSMEARAAVSGPVEIADVSTRLNHMLEQLTSAQISLRQSEAALAAERNLLHGIIDALPDYVSLNDAEGRYILTNQAMEQAHFAGRSGRGRKPGDLVAPALAATIEAEDSRVLRTGEPMLNIERSSIVNDEMRHRLVSKVPLRDAAGNIIGVISIGRDVTEMHRVVEVLRRSERSYANLVANISGAVYRCRNDPDWTIEFISDGCLDVTGYRSDELLRNRVTSLGALMHPDDVGPIWEKCQANLAERKACSNEYRIIHRRGEIRWVWDQAQGVYSDSGELLFIEGLLADITERYRAREAIEASERRFRALVENSSDGIALFDAPGRFRYVSPAGLRVSGFTPQDILGKGFAEFVHPEDLPAAETWYRALLGKERDPGPLEFRARHKDGSWFWLEVVGSNRLADPAVGAIVANYRDITERKRGEEERRALSRRLVETEEEERRKINRELHDRIGQNLSALNLNLGIVRGGLPGNLPQALYARFDDAQTLLGTTSQQVRDVMAELRPAALDDYGLLAALHAYAEPYSKRVGVPVSVQGRDLAPRPPLATEMALFRIAQEALSNIAKHARAGNADVSLTVANGRITLCVADDGVGFDPQETARSRLHWGMTTMRERAEAIGATLRVEAAPGRGTRVIVEVALG